MHRPWEKNKTTQPTWPEVGEANTQPTSAGEAAGGAQGEGAMANSHHFLKMYLLLKKCGFFQLSHVSCLGRFFVLLKCMILYKNHNIISSLAVEEFAWFLGVV